MKNSNLKTHADEISKITKGKKILFATVPADGHVNPLTGVAVYLKSIGYDVRWYTSAVYSDKINKININHYPFIKALDIRGDNVNELLPDRVKHKSAVAKLNFDIINFFIKRGPEYFEDIKEIYKEFAFDLMIADCVFTAIPFVKEKMNIPVIAMGILPLTETSRNLPPSGLGMTPSYSFFGKLKQQGLRWVAANILFKKSSKFLAQVAKEHGLSYEGQSIFDYIVKKSTLFLQSATPGFEYYRSDLGKNVRFLGPLLPYSNGESKTQWFDDRLTTYEKVIVVTQGTVEKDVEKLLVPTLEAYKNSDVLVVMTTGGSGTEELRKRYPEENFIIEDFIPFSDVMPYADVYVTNGGYGGVMLGIENHLPLVVGGVHEGKNEICARVGYFKLGINLKTETPTPSQIKQAVEELFTTPSYKENVCRLDQEFDQYNSKELTALYVEELLETKVVEIRKDVKERIY